MGVHEGHRERLRARFAKSGLESFEEHTALELLLFYARPRCDTNEIAHALLERFGSFSAVLDAPQEALVQVPGVGENTAFLLKLIAPMAAYYLNSRSAAGEVLDSTQKAGAYFVPKFVGKTTEEIYMAALDDRRKLIRCTRLSKEGIVNAVHITLRRVVTEAVNANATGIVLAHNHPGGIALPSGRDKQFTRQVCQALQFINVQLVDHIIVADDDYVSLSDSGFFEGSEPDGRI